jgi:phosphoenolpyruvate carboxylase
METTFTDEDRRNLNTLAEEIPRLRQLLEELTETLEIMSDHELIESIKTGEKELKRGEHISYDNLLKELSLDERET